MTHRASHRLSRAFVLPLSLMLITLAFGGWALLYQSTSTSIRQQQFRAMRESRAQWTARGMAAALRTLHQRIASGEVLDSTLEWEERVSRGEESREFEVVAERLLAQRWEIEVAPSDDLTSAEAL